MATHMRKCKKTLGKADDESGGLDINNSLSYGVVSPDKFEIISGSQESKILLEHIED